MFSEYFNQKFNHLENPELKQLVSSLTEKIISETKSKITQSLLSIQKRKRFISKSSAPEDPTEKPKHDKQTREVLQKDHQKKVEETKEFTKKLISERLQREHRNQELAEQARLKLLQSDEEQKKRQEELQKKLEEEKQRRLAEMIQKSDLRKKQIDELKEQFSSKKSQNKPLYRQMEDNYKQQVLMPNLEQQKAELAKKRILYQPINSEELKEHARKHEELRKEQEYKRRKELEQRNLEAQVNQASNNLYSKFTAAVLEEEKIMREKKNQAELEKLKNVQKRDQYAKLVKEMFPPLVNENKRFDAGEVKGPQKTTRSAKGQSRNASIAAVKISPVDYKSEAGASKIPKRKWKENNMIKKPEPKKEGKIVDYLLEKRNENAGKAEKMEDLEIDIEKEVYEEDFDEDKARKIKAKAAKLEKLANKQERLMGLGSNFKAIQAGDQVNDMILSSIKTKLALLDKFTAKN